MPLHCQPLVLSATDPGVACWRQEEAATEHMGSLRESLDWLLGQESMEMADEVLPSLGGADSGVKAARGAAGGFGAAR